MKCKSLISVSLCLGALIVAVPVPAHHSAVAFDTENTLTIKGRVTESSPERTENVFGTCWKMAAIWPMSPDASLTPTMLSIEARRANVDGVMFVPVRLGTL